MKKLRRVTEAEVIAEFLRAEFYHREYDEDRHSFDTLVNLPDLTNETENALRRALLFRRRDTMWRELPDDRHWWEVEFELRDIEQVSVFPRGQWRTVAQGDFQARHVAERLRQQIEQNRPSPLATKIHKLRGQWQLDGPTFTVILIGIKEGLPVTLLEGNHRFVASLMLPPEIMLRRLRVVCGFSPNMEKCCWYRTNLLTLSYYLKNRIKYFWSNETDVQRLLQQTAKRQAAGGYADPVNLK